MEKDKSLKSFLLRVWGLAKLEVKESAREINFFLGSSFGSPLKLGEKREESEK